MNSRDINEIRRRLTPDNNNLTCIRGCYVSSKKEIISLFRLPPVSLPPEECEKYLALFKKVLSGVPDKNLVDIAFANEAVGVSDEHRLLTQLRSSKLADKEARDKLYETIAQNLKLGESNLLVLLGCDVYDVPFRGKDGRLDEFSDSQFTYFVCAICPVKDGKLALGYFSGENEFHNCLCKQLVCAPETGFLFPAFDHRSSNIYNALFYSRKAEEMHYELIEALFRTEMAMSPAEERQAFEDTLVDAEITDLEISAPFTSKYGFSVVAPIRIRVPSSTKGRR